MLNAPLENRMAELENVLAHLADAQAATQHLLDQLARTVERSERDRHQMGGQINRLSDKMSQLSDETRLISERTDRTIANFVKETNQKFGEVANKMGLLVEDMVAPSIARIFQEMTGYKEEQILFSAIRVKLYHVTKADLRREFDAVVAGGDYLLINETKSQLDPEAVDKFIEVLQEARDFFPQYKEKKVIGALASLYIDTSLARHIEKQGLVAMAVGKNLMDVLNSPGFKPKEF